MTNTQRVVMRLADATLVRHLRAELAVPVEQRSVDACEWIDTLSQEISRRRGPRADDEPGARLTGDASITNVERTNVVSLRPGVLLGRWDPTR